MCRYEFGFVFSSTPHVSDLGPIICTQFLLRSPVCSRLKLALYCCLTTGGVLPGFVIEKEWGGRQARAQARIEATADRPQIRVSDGERLWKWAAEKHAGAGATSEVLPWKILYTHSLADYFKVELGDDGEYRPLQVSTGPFLVLSRQ